MKHRQGLFTWIIALSAIVFSSAVFARGVPPHLVPMAVDLLEGTKKELKKGVGGPEHRDICLKAYEMLRRRGLLHWARGSFMEKETMSRIAAALGIEKVGPGHLSHLQVFFETLKQAGTKEAIKAFHLSAGTEAPAGERLGEVAEEIEKALAEPWKGFERKYSVEGWEEGQSIQLIWNPKVSIFSIHIIDLGGADREPFKVTLQGRVNEKLRPDGEAIERFVTPSRDPVRARNAEDMEEETERSLQEVLGEWIDQEGDRWVVLSRGEKAGRYSRPLRLIHYEKGAELDWQGRLESGRIKAKRKATHLMDTKEDLPMEVRKQLITTWQPMLTLELETVRDRGTGTVELSGLYWSWHVTYDGYDYRVKRVHSTYSRPVTLVRDARIVSIRFIEPEPPYGILEVIQPGDDFRVRVVFDRDPGIDSESVSLKSPLTGDEIKVSAKQTARPPVFMTDPVRFAAPEKGKGLCPCEQQ